MPLLDALVARLNRSLKLSVVLFVTAEQRRVHFAPAIRTAVAMTNKDGARQHI